jgi:hypothetical protein
VLGLVHRRHHAPCPSGPERSSPSTVTPAPPRPATTIPTATSFERLSIERSRLRSRPWSSSRPAWDLLPQGGCHRRASPADGHSGATDSSRKVPDGNAKSEDLAPASPVWGRAVYFATWRHSAVRIDWRCGGLARLSGTRMTSSLRPTLGPTSRKRSVHGDLRCSP